MLRQPFLAFKAPEIQFGFWQRISCAKSDKVTDSALSPVGELVIINCCICFFIKEVHDSSQLMAKLGAACSRTIVSKCLETGAMIGQLKTAPTLTAPTLIIGIGWLQKAGLDAFCFLLHQIQHGVYFA